MADGDLVEGLDGGVAQGGLRGGAEELEDADGGGELFGRGGGQGDDGGGGLVDDHVGLVAQAGLDEVEEARVGGVFVLVELVGGDADEEAVGVGGLEGGAGELGDEFGDREFVVFLYLVEEAECVVLCGGD